MRKFFALITLAAVFQTTTHSPEVAAEQYAATWTRSTWSLSYPDYGPYFRAWVDMVHNPRLGKNVLFGGSMGVYANDIWHYDALLDRWDEVMPYQQSVGMTPPCGRDEHSVEYDSYNNYYWSYGGSGYACNVVSGTGQPGSTSTQLIDATLPATTADAYKDWVFIVNGVTPTFGTYVDSYDPVAKRLTLKQAAPTSLAGASYRMRPQAGGGTWYFDPTTQEWGSLDGSFWGYTGPNPTSRLSPAFAFSSRDNTMVMFGGDQTSDTWKLDVTTNTWTQMKLNGDVNSPPGMAQLTQAMVYDPVNDVFVLFGGRCNDNYGRCIPYETLGDTWTYKLSTNTWTKMNPGRSPAPRQQFQMAYDLDKQVFVLFGGHDNSNFFNDLWTYDYRANTWTEIPIPAVNPGNRYLGSLVYDSTNNVSVLYGGIAGDGDERYVWQLRLAVSGQPANVPPTVALTTVVSNTGFVAPTNLNLTASAADSDGSVTQVEFLRGTTVIGTSTGPTFSFNWTNVAAGSYMLTARATDNSGATTTSAPINVTVAAPPTGSINVAAQANGGVATASSTYIAAGYNFSPAAANDGRRTYVGWGTGGAWLDSDSGVFPDWLQITFNGVKTVNRVDVFSVQDAYTAPVDPTPTMTFSLYGLQDFAVQYWDGNAWITVPGGSVTENTLVWRTVTFPPVTTDRIRVLVARALAHYSRIVEIEAWDTSGAPANSPPTVSLTAPANNANFSAPASISLTASAADSDGSVTQVEFLRGTTVIGTSTGPTFSFNWTNVAAGSYMLTARATDNSGATTTSAPINVTVAAPPTGSINVAAQANGGVATASSTYIAAGYNFSPAAANDGRRTYVGWGTGGAWLDSDSGVFPDWLQITFNGVKTVDRVDVFSVQDAYTAPVDPTPTMTFSLYGLQDFAVQYWDGNAWITVPGGSVTENTLVWRTVTFPPVTTDRIRVLVARALAHYSRIVEIEAWDTSGAPANSPPTVSLTAPANNANFSAPASISLTASAADSDGSVTQVEFLRGTTVIGTSTGPTFSFNWTNVAAGSYMLTARATDNSGATTTSAPINVTVAAPPTGSINVAAQANGGVATASSTYIAAGYNFSPAAANDGRRTYVGWGTGGAWLDSDSGVFPDWLQITFNGVKTVNRVDVFSVQDAYTAPVDPTPTMTFSLYGLQDFAVQYWDGNAWITVPGGSVTENTLVWRTVTFPPVTTDRIRVLVARALAHYSRIVEIEAWDTSGAPANSPPTVSLTAPANNANFSAPASISLTASAADSDGSVTQVEFLRGTTVIGTSTGPTFSFNWTNVAAGSYMLTARATDNSGATTTSAPINVTVNTAPPLIAISGMTLTGSVNDLTITQLIVNGLSVPVINGQFQAPISLSPGTSTHTISATNGGGTTTKTLTIAVP